MVSVMGVGGLARVALDARVRPRVRAYSQPYTLFGWQSRTCSKRGVDAECEPVVCKWGMQRVRACVGELCLWSCGRRPNGRGEVSADASVRSPQSLTLLSAWRVYAVRAYAGRESSCVSRGRAGGGWTRAARAARVGVCRRVSCV